MFCSWCLVLNLLKEEILPSGFQIQPQFSQAYFGPVKLKNSIKSWFVLLCNDCLNLRENETQCVASPRRHLHIIFYPYN